MEQCIDIPRRGERAMGRTVEKVRIRNYLDVFQASKGLLSEDQIRTAAIEAVVDTGATYLCLSPSVIERVGLECSRSVNLQTANGGVERRIFSLAEITVKDRTIQMDVMENDEHTSPLVGYLVLEALDLVVNPRTQKLTGNPEHEGKWVADLYRMVCPQKRYGVEEERIC